MKNSDKISEVRFRQTHLTPSFGEMEGIVINPGAWFGKVWIIQIAIANALNPFYAIEADTEQDAVDVLADSERFGHLINVDEEDCPKWVPDDSEDEGDYEESDFTQAGNDSHWVDLTRCHIQKAPADLKYVLEWKPLQDDLSSVIDAELETVRDELERDKAAEAT